MIDTTLTLATAAAALLGLVTGLAVGVFTTRTPQPTPLRLEDAPTADRVNPPTRALSSVPLPGVTPLPTGPRTPQPAMQATVERKPRPAASLLTTADTGRHHRSFDPIGVETTRFLPPARRKQVAK